MLKIAFDDKYQQKTDYSTVYNPSKKTYVELHQENEIIDPETKESFSEINFLDIHIKDIDILIKKLKSFKKAHINRQKKLIKSQIKQLIKNSNP